MRLGGFDPGGAEHLLLEQVWMLNGPLVQRRSNRWKAVPPGGPLRERTYLRPSDSLLRRSLEKLWVLHR